MRFNLTSVKQFYIPFVWFFSYKQRDMCKMSKTTYSLRGGNCSLLLLHYSLFVKQIFASVWRSMYINDAMKSLFFLISDGSFKFLSFWSRKNLQTVIIIANSVSRTHTEQKKSFFIKNLSSHTAINNFLQKKATSKWWNETGRRRGNRMNHKFRFLQFSLIFLCLTLRCPFMYNE